ncbi:MAG: hypothetical protein RSE54_11405 [Ruthenibacterium sp.]
MALYYLTFVSWPEFESYKLSVSPAGQNKSDFIIRSLCETGMHFSVVSLASTSNRTGIFPAKTIAITEQASLQVFWGFGQPNRLVRKLHSWLRKAQLFLFLMKLSKKDVVIDYHSLGTAKTICMAKKLRGFKLILELEEIYQDVVKCNNRLKKNENEILQSADAYLLSVKGLTKRISSVKPYIVANGSYTTEPNRNVSFVDAKVHCVYAGTFDLTKGGAAAAAAAAAFLPENYHVHILGFGTEKQKKNLMEQIEEVKEKCKCTLTYDGLLSGEEYICFLQKCQIGLCTQIPDATYTETSFPSKVLVYMANGLHVLSPRIKAVEESGMGDLIHYYDEQTPQCIANAIEEIDMQQPYDSRTRLQQFDKQFALDLQTLLKGLCDDASLTN